MGGPLMGHDRELLAWLKTLLGDDAGNLCRVIIDIPVNGLVTVYTEQYPDKDILSEPIPQAILQAGLLSAKELDNGKPKIREAVCRTVEGQEDSEERHQEESGQEIGA